VRWSGRFDAPAHLLAGTQHAGQRGYDVYQAFVRPDGERVLVDRGWIPADAADATVAAALSVDQPTLTGQLRPAPPDDGAVPVEGHGTRIWAPGGQGGIAAAVGAARGVYVVSGNPDGSPTGPGPITDGFVPVPARDNTSAHYASQWAAVALIGLLFAFPGPLLRLRRKMGA
jgi:cytochrome oxidase assembly protein ShyY1